MEDELEDDDDDFNNDDEGDLECFDPDDDPDDPIICEMLGDDLLALLDDELDECFELLDVCLLDELPELLDL